jgi:hypothetical protein
MCDITRYASVGVSSACHSASDRRTCSADRLLKYHRASFSHTAVKASSPTLARGSHRPLIGRARRVPAGNRSPAAALRRRPTAAPRARAPHPAPPRCPARPGIRRHWPGRRASDSAPARAPDSARPRPSRLGPALSRPGRDRPRVAQNADHRMLGSIPGSPDAAAPLGHTPCATARHQAATKTR